MVDVILNHISYGLSSLTMYLFFLHLTQQPDTTWSFTFKTPSREGKLAVEKLSMRVS